MNNDIERLRREAAKVLLGKEDRIDLVLVALLCSGHVLIEDIPGVGKTTLVRILAKLLGLELSRIQFTNDLLPADIIGTSVYDKDKGEFRFIKGPLFGELVLADELNRATPKTQSSLLQAMEERRVSVDGIEYLLPPQFLLMATQNPFEQIGTYALPESQLDRFFISFTIDFPEREYERAILSGSDPRDTIATLPQVIDGAGFERVRSEVRSVHLSSSVLDYILDILESGRKRLDEGHALSPRAGRDLVAAAKARAYIKGSDHVVPEDIQFMAPYILGHRLGGARGVRFGQGRVRELISMVKLNS
jgi:MoxR-like ATPase